MQHNSVESNAGARMNAGTTRKLIRQKDQRRTNDEPTTNRRRTDDEPTTNRRRTDDEPTTTNTRKTDNRQKPSYRYIRVDRPTTRSIYETTDIRLGRSSDRRQRLATDQTNRKISLDIIAVIADQVWDDRFNNNRHDRGIPRDPTNNLTVSYLVYYRASSIATTTVDFPPRLHLHNSFCSDQKSIEDKRRARYCHIDAKMQTQRCRHKDARHESKRVKCSRRDRKKRRRSQGSWGNREGRRRTRSNQQLIICYYLLFCSIIILLYF